jgi:hypothetical protein
MLIQVVLVVSLLAVFSKATISVCQFNFNGYYIVHGNVSKREDQSLPGFPSNLTDTICSMQGLRVANITTAAIPGILNIWYQCSAGMIPTGLWFDYFEGLPVALDCNYLDSMGSVASSSNTCMNSFFPVLCELAEDIEVTTTTSTTTTTTSTIGGTSDSLEIIYTTTTVNTLVFTQVVTTEYEVRTNITNTTRTITSCNTVPPTCCPNHNEYHYHIHNHYYNCCHHNIDGPQYPGVPGSYAKGGTTNCHDCNYKWQDNKASALKSLDLKVIKPKQSPFYVECDFTSNDFRIISQTQLKSRHAPKIEGDLACESFGYNLANITAEVQPLISVLLQACNATEAMFKAYYDYLPICGIIGTDEVVLVDQNTAPCNLATVAVCKIGPNDAVTSVIPTGPFASNTVTETDTLTEVTTTTSFIIGTLTEYRYTTATNTLYSSFTSTTTARSITSLTKTILTTVGCHSSR